MEKQVIFEIHKEIDRSINQKVVVPIFLQIMLWSSIFVTLKPNYF